MHRAHILPATLNPLHGAFVEPLACTLHGITLARRRFDRARRIDPLISRVIPLSQAAEAVANPPRPGEVKVLIQP